MCQLNCGLFLKSCNFNNCNCCNKNKKPGCCWQSRLYRLNFCMVTYSHGHMTMLTMAIPDAEILEVQFSLLCCGWTIHATRKLCEEVNRNRNCPPRNTMVPVQLSTTTSTLSATILIITDRQMDKQTDRRQYRDNSWSLLHSSTIS